MATLTDRRVLRRSSWEKAGETFWEDLVHRYGALLKVRIRVVLRAAGIEPAPERVEEMVQEAYFRLLSRGLKQLDRGVDNQDRVPAYMARIAERVAIDEVRAQRAGRHAKIRWVPFDDEGLAADPGGSPEDRFLREEKRRLFLARCRSVAALALGRENRQRNFRILHLAFLEGWSSREIARAEGRLAPSTVDTVVSRARRLLERRLGVALPSRSG
jgi:DNA-directed RNA polymerase specialized sigma24 family protein